MKTSGEIDPLYVRARAALLDMAAALDTHIESVVLVGAQAIYLHTGAAKFEDIPNFPEYTTDADFTISPSTIADTPIVSELLIASGFSELGDPGAWQSAEGVHVDLMVPESLAGSGRRGADLGAHGRRVARRAKGLEGALTDRDRHLIEALDDTDIRSASIWVAGPAALLVAKTHKIAERVDVPDRISNKDAIDLLRLVRSVPGEVFVEKLVLLEGDDVAGAVTTEAIALLKVLFGTVNSAGSRSAAQAFPNSDTAVASLVALVNELLDNLSRS